MAYVLKGFVQTVNSMLVAIQGLSTLLNKLEKCLELLVNTLKQDCNVKGPDQFTDLLEHVLCGPYLVSYEDAVTLIKDQDLFILCLLEDKLTTKVSEYTKVIQRTALLYAYSVDGITRIVASQNAQNRPTNNLPPVMLQELIQMRPFEFSQIVLLHKQHLEALMSEYDIVKITDEFKQLQNAYQSEDQTKSIINGFEYKTSFEHGWRPFIDQFPALCAFTGGLASVIPGTGSDTNFSFIGWEKMTTSPH